jgi:predicted enzyme related to lactoylglutathione lyase
MCANDKRGEIVMLRYSIGCILGVVLFGLSVTASAEETKVTTPRNATEARIGFVKIKVGDLEKAIDFYHRVLQMQDIGRIGDKSGQIQEATLKFGASVAQAKASDHTGIVLVFQATLKKQFQATDDIPVAVLTVPDVAAVAKRAADAGFTVSKPPRDVGNVVAAEIRDSSGNVVELIHLK